MLRHRSLTLALCLTAVIAVSACGKKKPTPSSSASLRRRPRSLRIRRLRRAPPTPAAPESRVPTEEELFAKMTLDELNAKKPLATVLFSLRQLGVSEEGRASRSRRTSSG